MSTTALFVEILVMGAIADIWLFLLLLAVVSPNANAITKILTSISGIGNLLIFPILGITYALGFCINFLSDQFFRRIIQQKIRNKVVDESGLENQNYYYIRSYFTQEASESLTKDWYYTRHSIRIARSSVLNFFLMACTLFLYVSKSFWGVVVSASICLVITFAAFWQASTLSKANYKRLIQDYKVLREISKND